MQLCTGEWHKSKVAGRNPFGILRNVETSLSDVSTDDETFRHRRNVETKRNVETLANRFNQSKCRFSILPIVPFVPGLESALNPSFPSFPVCPGLESVVPFVPLCPRS